jgi:hypothetical protein
MSLPKMARRSFRSPSSWATEITLQFRYPAGIRMSKSGEALASAPSVPEGEPMATASAATARNEEERRFMAPDKHGPQGADYCTKVSITSGGLRASGRHT